MRGSKKVKYWRKKKINVTQNKRAFYMHSFWIQQQSYKNDNDNVDDDDNE